MSANQERKLDLAKGGLLPEGQQATLVLQEVDVGLMALNDGSQKVLLSAERINSFYRFFREIANKDDGVNVTNVNITLNYHFGIASSNYQRLLKQEGLVGWLADLALDNLCIGVVDLVVSGPMGKVTSKIGKSVAKSFYKAAVKQGMTKSAARKQLFKTAIPGVAMEIAKVLDSTEFCLVDFVGGDETPYEVDYILQWHSERPEKYADEPNHSFKTKYLVRLPLVIAGFVSSLFA